MTKAAATPKPITGAERQKAYRQRGRQVSAVLTDELAIAKLDTLVEKSGGSVKLAIEKALRAARVT